MIIDDSRLERECRVFSAYLTGNDCSSYVIDRYLEAHHCCVLGPGATRFEHILVSVACKHQFLARVADAYARFFAMRSLLRNKLVLLLALLETSAPSYRWIDDVPAGGRLGILAALVVHGIAGMICLALGLILFTPTRLLTRTKKSI